MLREKCLYVYTTIFALFWDEYPNCALQVLSAPLEKHPP